MISLLVILSLFSFPAATGLWCFHCGTGPCTVDSPRLLCPSTHACGSDYTIQGSDRNAPTILNRTCVPKSQCGFVGSRTTEGPDEPRKVISCCNKLMCIPDYGKYQYAMEDYVPNGLECPSFSSHGRTMIQCRGYEKWCFFQTRNIPGSDLFSTAIWGCTTESYCDKQITDISESLNKEIIICTKASKPNISNTPQCLKN